MVVVVEAVVVLVVVVVGGERHSPATVPWRVYIHTRMTPHPPQLETFLRIFPRKFQSLSPVSQGGGDSSTVAAAAFSNP